MLPPARVPRSGERADNERRTSGKAPPSPLRPHSVGAPPLPPLGGAGGGGAPRAPCPALATTPPRGTPRLIPYSLYARRHFSRSNVARPASPGVRHFRTPRLRTISLVRIRHYATAGLRMWQTAGHGARGAPPPPAPPRGGRGGAPTE